MGRRNYIMDITKHAFEAKRKHFEIKDEDLEKAAQFALIEAGEWSGAVKELLKRGRFTRQICVMLVYSIEIYLKAILMKKGINISKEKHCHEIYSMYKKLNDSEKKIIKDNIDSSVEHTDIEDNYIKIEAFEKMLEFVSNDFVNLRYNYEKYVNGEPIYTIKEFVLAVNENCQKLAKSIIK